MMPTVFDKIPPNTREQLEKFTLVYIIWAIVSGVAYGYLPEEWQWICYGPVAFLALVVVITGIAILAYPILPKPIHHVYVGRAQVTCCQYCPMAEIKDNPVGNIPIIKCREVAKVCYMPATIPRWCPYAD